MSVDTAPAPVRGPVTTAPGLVDCDIHPSLSPTQINRHLAPRWQRQAEVGGLLRVARESHYYPRPRRRASRTDAFPPSGGGPGSDPDFLRQQLLDHWDVAVGILNPSHQMLLGNEMPQLASSVLSAVNDCIRDEWLEPEPRLMSSICVAWEDAALAAAEIRRRAGDPRFVQVLGNIRNREPLGNRKYWKIYETAVELDLPVAIHVAGGGGNTMTGAGFPSYYFEDHSGFAQAFYCQMVSLLVEGVFEHFPTLRIVLQEGGFSWVAPMSWRLDAAWSMLREEVPFLERPPSEYIHEHFWYTTQPIEEPRDPRQLVEAYSQLGLQDRLLFSSDYPHWDFDAPNVVLPAAVPADVRSKIFGENARRLYGWT